ncbi:hypothetical protein, partial [Streptomyces gulbargensis]|uniref:hypothetical protein n=1 Tax=Streptomyces gulbargensis TaxID=364901 RepID=UPI0031EB1D22
MAPTDDNEKPETPDHHDTTENPDGTAPRGVSRPNGPAAPDDSPAGRAAADARAVRGGPGPAA